MTRRILRTNRALLSRRVVEMMTSLFRRRFGFAPARCSRRGRGRAQPQRGGFVGALSHAMSAFVGSAAHTFNTAKLTLTQPESLEARLARAGFDVDGTTLAVWTDTNSETVEVFSPVAGVVRVMAGPSQLYEGTMPSSLVMFDENKLTTGAVSLSPISTPGATSFGGSGYTTAPTVSLDFLADGVTKAYYVDEGNTLGATAFAATASAFLAISTTGVTVTAGGTGYAVNDTITLTQKNALGTTVEQATLKVTAIGVGGVITTVATTGAGADLGTDFTNLTGLAVSTNGTGTGATFTVTGRVDRITVDTAGTKVSYFANPTPRLTGGGFTTTAFANASLLTSTGTTGESVTIRAPGSSGGASGFTPSLSIGVDPTAAAGVRDIDTVTFATQLATVGGITVDRVGTFTQTQSATATGAIAITTATNGTIDIQGGASLTGSSVSLAALGAASTLTLDSGTVKSTTGSISVTTAGSAGVVSTSRNYDAKTSLSISASHANGDVAMTFASGNSLKANNGAISLSADGDVSLSGSPYSLTASGGSGDINIFGDSITVTGVQSITAANDFVADADTGALSLAGTSTATITASDLINLDAETSLALNIKTTGGSVMLDAWTGAIHITKLLTATVDVFMQADDDITLDGSLVADDTIQIIAGERVLGLGVVTAEELLLTAGNIAPVILSSSVDRLTATTGGPLTVTNSKSLDVLAAEATGNVSITTTGATSDLTLSSDLKLLAGEFLTLSSSRSLVSAGTITSVEDVSLTAVAGSIRTGTVAVTKDVVAKASTGIDMSGSVSAATFSLLTTSGDIAVSAQSPAGSVTVAVAETGDGDVSLTATTGNLQIVGNVMSGDGDVTLVSDLGKVVFSATANVSTPISQGVTVDAAGQVAFAAGAKLATGVLDYTSSNGSMLLQDANASFHTLTADVTGANNDLVVVQAADLDLAGITTKNGDVDVTLTAGNLTVSGGIDAGTGDVVFDVQQGGISAPASIEGDQLTSDSNLTATYADLNVATLVASVSAVGENLTVVNAGDLKIGAGNVTVNGGAVSIELANGDLTRTGRINTAGGSLLIDVGDKSILSTGAISTNRLEWIAKAAPNETGLTYSALDATMTAAGDLVIARPAALAIDSITLADGDVNISVAAGDLTLNGSVASSGNLADITLKAATGGIVFQSGTLVADDLSLTADGDIEASINAATLVAESTNGSVTVTETNGLEILAGGVSAARNVSITLTAGSLLLTGGVTAGTTASDKVVLDVEGGTISGPDTVAVANGSLFWTARQAPDDTKLSYTNLSATVTGAGNHLVIDRTTNLNLLGATTVDGDISVNTGSQALTVLGNITAGNSGDIDITADSITFAPAFFISGGALTVSASGTSTLRVNVDSLEADIGGNASLTVESLSDLEIAANGVSLLNGAIDIGVVTGNLTLTGDLTTNGNNVSLDVHGDIVDNGGEVEGDVLNVTVGGDATLDTKVNTLVGSVNGSLTLVNTISLQIGLSGVSGGGDIDLTSQTGDLSGTGSLTAGEDITLSAVAGSITFASSAGQVAGDLLAITAAGPVSMKTDVASIDAEITGAGATLDVVEVDAITVIVGSLDTTNGDINLTTGGNLTIAGAVDAGTANVTLDVTGSIDGAGLITAGTLNIASNATIDASVNTDVDDLVANITGGLTVTETDAINATVAATSLDLTAGGDADLTTTIGELVADITGDLTVGETDDLDIGAGDVVATGDISLALAGNLAGAGDISADGDVTLNATGTIVLNGTEQVSGDVLDITSGGDADIGTNVSTLVADITGNLTVVEAGNLLIGAGGVTATGDISLDVAGSLGGTGVIDAGAGAEDITLVSGDTITLNAADQITGNVLAITAGDSVGIGTDVAVLTANVASGDLVVDEADDLVIEGEATASSGDVSITLGGDLSGDGSIAAGSDVSLDAGGNITLNAAGQISGSLLDLTAGGEADVGTDVTTLVANVTGNLTIAETDGLAIGVAGVESQTGNISVSLAGGSLTGTGDVGANNAVSIVLQADGNIDLTTGQIQAVELSVATQGTGDVAINTAVANITATVLDGSLVVTEANDLRIVGITGENGTIAVTLTSGDLTIDSGSILGGQLSDVTLDVAAGSITSVDDADAGNYGVVTGRHLVITAQNTSAINTSVTTLAGQVTGAGEDLTITEQDGAGYSGNVTIAGDSLAIAAAGLSANGGDITITMFAPPANVSSGGLVLDGNISTTGDVTLNIASGGITSTDSDGFIAANVATLLGADDVSVFTDATTLIADVTGDLTVVEVDDLEIGADVEATGDIDITLGGDITGSGNIAAGDDVTLDATGSITLSGTEQISGDVLDVTAGGDADLGTNVATLIADITGSLTVVEADDLIVGADVEATGDIDITLGGNLTGSGNIAAGDDVTLNATGSITLSGTEQISGDVLDVTAGGDADLGTNVATLIANITGSLTVVEADDLIVGADVEATGDIDITLGGDLTGSGNIAAGDDVTLNATGSITLSGTEQISGDVLDVTAGGDADLGTNVATLIADITGSLAVVEADDLIVGADVEATGDIDITLGGDLTGSGNIAAGDDVTLDASGNITLNAASQITGDLLDVTTGGDADLGTNIVTLVADIAGNLTVVEADDLSIGAADVMTTAGDISITLGSGSLTGGAVSSLGNISAAAGAANVTLDVSGSISLVNGVFPGTPGFSGAVIADTLDVTAGSDADIDAEIDILVANVTGNLTVFELDALEIGANVVATEDIELRADGSINGTGLISGADITLRSVNADITLNDSAAQVSGTSLALFAADDSAVNTSVSTLTGITGNNLTIVEASGLSIGGANLVVGGDLAIELTAGSLTGPGRIDATGDVTLNVSAGSITFTNSVGQVSGDVLDITAQNDSAVNTDVSEIVANITGAGESLTIVETDNLIIGAGNVVTDGGDIDITTSAGSLTITGEINATTAANVTLDVTGAISGAGLITADTLFLTSTQDANVTTSINALDADSGAGKLVVTEADDLSILDVDAGTDVEITLTAGNLTGPGSIVAGDDITLNVAAGSITLTNSAGQVQGDLLDIAAQDSSAINTKVATLVANITGAGETLTITEFDALTIGASDVVTNAGKISITTGGSLTVTGDINTTDGSANVTLDVTGSISGTGLITADELEIDATGSATVTTNIASLDADVGASLTVTEADDLDITSVVAGDDVSLTLLTGNLTGVGPITAADDIVLNVSGGNITLNTTSGQISGDLLTISAQDSSNIKTNVGSLAAELTTDGASLDVVEVNALTIAAGDVSVTNGTINITTGGSLTLTGDIDAQTTGNVTLVSGGAVTSAGGSVLADLLDLTAVSTSSVATTVNNLTARITGSSSQGLTINETDGLTVTADGVETTGGPIQIALATGDLDIEGDVKSATGTVTLTATNGGITTDGATIIANRLVLSAKNDSDIDTTIAFLSAQITGAGESLTVDETNALVIDGSGVVTSDGDVVLNIGTPVTGTLTLTSGIAAGSGDVTVTGRSVTGAGLVTADTLSLDLAATSSVKTSVSTIQGVVTSGFLTVSETNDLAIGADDLVASGNGGRITITTGGTGDLTGPGDIVASTGSSRITLTVGGDASMTGKVNAGAAGLVTLTAGGEVSMNASEQITGQQLTLTAAGNVDIGTRIAALSATVTGSTKTLKVTEYDGLTVSTATTKTGNIHLITGDVAAGDMVITGPVNAGTANVLLESQNGSIVTTGTGLITANQLTVEAAEGSVNIKTNVTGLAATLANSGESLTVVETNGLQILAGNITTNDGDVDLTLTAPGSLTADGSINAGTGDVKITAAGGSVTVAAHRITADELTINALGAVNVQTDVSNIAVTTTGSALAVTVSDSGSLAIDGIDTNNGQVSVTAADDITGAGDIDAGTAGVTLIADNINITGLVTGNALSLDVAADANLTTSVNSLAGSVDGTLDLVESAGLVIAAAGVNGGDLNIKVLDGSLTGTGVISAPGKAVSLTADNGAIQLASKVGQIVADSLHVSAKTSALVNTNVNTLTADQAGTLTVTEVDGLAISAAGIDTSAGNGDVSLTVSKGNLNGPGGIVAGTGDIKISVPLGAVTLTSDPVAGDLLTVTARTGANLKTDVNTADVQVTSTGGVTISEVDDLTVVRAIAAVAGDVSITLTGPGDLTLQTVTATGAVPNGDVVLATNNGDVFINGKLSASQKLDVSGVNGQVVLGKSGTITTGKASGSIVQKAGEAIEFVVDSGVASVTLGTGSLGSAITRINGLSVGTRAEIDVQTTLNVSVTSALPTINRETDILGNGKLTLTASPAGNTFNGLTLNASGSSIDGVTFKNFGGAAINLIGGTTLAAARVMTVTDVVIENSRIGLQATNFFTGGSGFGGAGDTSVIDAKNRQGSYGVLLSNARGFRVESVDIARAQIGISIAGKSEGTVVTQNRISGREDVTTGYGISLANATGLSGNSLTVSQNQIDQFLNGVFASGYCTFATVSGTAFNDLSFDTNSSGISSANRYNVSRSRNLTVFN